MRFGYFIDYNYFIIHKAKTEFFSSLYVFKVILKVRNKLPRDVTIQLKIQPSLIFSIFTTTI